MDDSPFRSPPSLPQPSWKGIGLLTLALGWVAAGLYLLALPVLRSHNALPIPGQGAVEALQLNLAEQESLTFEQVRALAEAGEFEPMPPPREVKVMNVRAHQVRWYRLTLHNDTGTWQHGVLDMIWRIYDHVTCYRQADDGTWETRFVGSEISPHHPQKSRRMSAFAVSLPPGGSSVLYLRAQDYFRLPAQFQYWPDHNDFQRWEVFFLGRVLGFLFIWLTILCFGSFRFALLPQREQLYYVLFAGAMGVMYLTSNGLLSMMFALPSIALGESIVGVSGFLAMVFLCLFTRSFLETGRHQPKMDRLIRGAQGFWVAMIFTIPLALSPAWGIDYLALSYCLAVVTLGLLLGAALLRWKAGSRLGLFFCMAFLPFSIGMAFLLGNTHDFAVRDDEQRLLTNIGSTLSLLLLSLAPIYRNRLVREEHYRLQVDYSRNLESDVKRRTRELLVLSQQLRHAVQERDHILAIIGHDLRGPAISLHTLTQLVETDRSFSQQELAEWTSKVRTASAAHLELLHNLIIWGGAQSGSFQPRPEPVPVHGQLEAAWDHLRKLSPLQNISFHHEIPPGLEVHVDATLLQTVLRNLLANAVKFSPPGSRITATAEASDRQVIIGIHDRGTGIDPQRLASLLQRVVEPAKGADGTVGQGIGLILCRELMHKAGGGIRIESTPGQGTSVFVTVPRLGEERASNTSRQPAPGKG